jgi:hypothetical protein
MGHCSRKPGAERRRFFEIKRYVRQLRLQRHRSVVRGVLQLVSAALPLSVSAVNPDAVHDHGQPTRQRHDRLLHPTMPGDLHRPGPPEASAAAPSCRIAGTPTRCGVVECLRQRTPALYAAPVRRIPIRSVNFAADFCYSGKLQDPEG